MEIADLVSRINTAMRKQTGMEIRLLKYEFKAFTHHCELLVGLRYGHPTWYEAVPTSPLKFQFPSIADVPTIASLERIEHHSYAGEFSFSDLAVERHPELSAHIADTLARWWQDCEAMEMAEKAYKALSQEDQETIGYFVDEPFKVLDLQLVVDRFALLAYRLIEDEGLIRVDRSVFDTQARVYPTDKGKEILRYLARQRKKENKADGFSF